jgi:hypothetical protein
MMIDKKPFCPKPRVFYSRIGDMSWNRSLIVMMEGDGDLVIGIGRKLQCDDGQRIVSYPQRLHEDELLHDDDEFAMVEFCTYAGRGRSPKVRKAIINLVEAMIEDEKENPIKLVTYSEWEKRKNQFKTD